MTCCQNFYVEIQGEHLITRALFEILHTLLRHLDVLEHDFKSLSKLETTLLFQLLNHLLFCFLEYPS